MKRLQHRNKLMPKPVRVLDKWFEVENNFFLELEVNSCYSVPGQFIQVGLAGVGEAPISIASHGDTLLLNINIVGKVTRMLSKVKPHEYVLVRGPLGKGYPLQSLKGNNLVLIGGGCGVAPLAAVLDYVCKNRQDFESVKCFFGFKSPDQVIFKKQIKRWAEIANINISVDKDLKLKQELKQLQGIERFINFEGFVTQALEQSFLTNNNIVAFICGPPIMMKHAVKVLKSKGFKDEQIFLSMERLMYCGIGYCCHCMINDLYTCIDGPVFRLDVLRSRPESGFE